jgi:hypothetical protein
MYEIGSRSLSWDPDWAALDKKWYDYVSTLAEEWTRDGELGVFISMLPTH